MLASNEMSLRPKPVVPPLSTQKVQIPTWINRLLGVRPAPEVIVESHTSSPLPTVLGVTTASAFRAHPR